MTRLLSRLDFRSAGESHGPAVVAVLEGVPRGLHLDVGAIDAELRRRQGGAGRGGRQAIERDRVEFWSGVRRGETIGSPLTLVVHNRDHKIDELPEPTRPRPGHADLSGSYRYLDHDIRGTLERASARETAARVAAGAVARQVLSAVGVELIGFVRSVGTASLPVDLPGEVVGSDLGALRAVRDQSLLYTLDPEHDREMMQAVKAAGRVGDTIGGVVEVQATGMVPGTGSHLQWHEKLDARLAAGVMSIQAFKGVEIGAGFGAAERPGSAVHDPIRPGVPVERSSNGAGGIEGGMTNGQNVVVRGAMKPIATLKKALPSIDLSTGEAVEAGYERSDVCAVSAASVVAEAMVALILADAALTRVGGETMMEFVARAAEHRRACADLAGGGPPGTP